MVVLRIGLPALVFVLAQTYAPIRPAVAAAACVGGNTTSSIITPPTNGSHPYSPPGSWLPSDASFLAAGTTYTDDVLGGVVRRVTNTYPNLGGSRHYSSNGWQSVSGTYIFQGRPGGDVIVNATTGATVCSSVPGGNNTWFLPTNDDQMAYWDTLSIKIYSVSSCTTTSTLKTFTGSGSLISLGDALDSMDRTARYWVARWNDGSSTKTRIWDRQTDTVYTGGSALDPGQGFNCGISPDGNYYVCFGNNDGRSWAIDHGGTQLVDSYVQFQTVGQGHGDVISASDGHTYGVTTYCGGPCGVAAFRVDTDMTGQAQSVQIASPNKNLIPNMNGSDLYGHFSCAGMTSDNCWFDSENYDDTFAADTSNWRAYRSEIINMNVVTGVVRRYAHHRSRDETQYWSQPKVSVTWDGYRAMWDSNHGYNAGSTGYADAYTTDCREGTTVAPIPLEESNETLGLRSVDWAGVRFGGGVGHASQGELQAVAGHAGRGRRVGGEAVPLSNLATTGYRRRHRVAARRQRDRRLSIRLQVVPLTGGRL